MLIEFHLKQKITIYEQAMTLRATKKLTISSFFLPLPSSYGNICCQVSKEVMQNLTKFQQSDRKLLFLENGHRAKLPNIRHHFKKEILQKLM